MGNTSSRPHNPRAPREIYYDLVSYSHSPPFFPLGHPAFLTPEQYAQGYGDIISNPLVAPAAEEAPSPKLKGRRTLSFALTRRSTAQKARTSRVIGGYPKNYHW